MARPMRRPHLSFPAVAPVAVSAADAAAPTRVLLVDDHAVFRRGMRSVIDEEPDMSVVAEVGSIAELASKHPDRVDVALVDVRLPDGSGIDVAADLLSADPAVSVVMLTVSDDDGDLYGAVKAGAVGYLLKEIAIDAVADAVRSAARGESSFSPQMATKLVSGFTHMSTLAGHGSGPAALTKRETEVLGCVAEGWSNRRIADNLHLSENTVKNHVRNICGKLGAHSRTEAVARGVKAGWISLA